MINVERIANANRKDCWCQPIHQPCKYHEGFRDGLDAYEQALAHERDPK